MKRLLQGLVLFALCCLVFSCIGVYASESTVEAYSKEVSGDTYLSKNFVVKEFACNDGSDVVLVDSALVDILQNIRDHFGAPITITSAYRTPEYNAQIGGAPNSYHAKGMAADIMVEGVAAIDVAKYAESIGVCGIGLYTGFVHVDSRDVKYYWTDNGSSSVSTFGGSSNSSSYGKATAAHVHSYKVNCERQHPHKEYKYCSCGASYYTGANWTVYEWEAAYPHKIYSVCPISSCADHRGYTGETKK